MPDQGKPWGVHRRRAIPAGGAPDFGRADAGRHQSVRCAIYTRKSTDEGLDQAFNSLDAQREACAAYILSQQHEGWEELSGRYDDGGFSGGSMERPGLAALLKDIKAGLIDTVVVYKVDRLTRSLSDFARIVEQFEGQGVSFVSVTQQFNTTTSMGRLTLNVLLSFAQFEREVTAERIRDKIAASKKKGMWMGGVVPMGYRVEDRKLVIEPAAAASVRRIFDLYLTLGSVRAVKAACDQEGILTPERVSRSGRRSGGQPLGRGPLYWLLRNSIYIGRVKHRGDTYRGQHKPVIDRATWDAVQQQLDSRARFHATSLIESDTHLFRGRIVDEAGQPLHATKSSKNGKHYFYYTSRCLMAPAENKDRGWRVPAHRLDVSIVRHLARTLGDPIRLAQLIDASGDSVPDPVALADRSAHIAALLEQPCADAARSLLGKLVKRICLLEGCIQIDLWFDQLPLGPSTESLQQHSNAPSASRGSGPTGRTTTIRMPIHLERRSSGTRMIIHGPGEREANADPAMIKLIVQAHRWHQMLGNADATSIRNIAAREKVEESEISRVIALASLAPDIVEAVLDGTHPPGLTVTTLRRTSRLPLDWSAQRELLGFKR